jgi:hypothetical protein
VAANPEYAMQETKSPTPQNAKRRREGEERVLRRSNDRATSERKQRCWIVGCFCRAEAVCAESSLQPTLDLIISVFHLDPQMAYI